MKVSVIVVAAGTGSRFGYERNKLFYPLCGEPVLTHTLRHIFAARSVSEVVIVHSRVDEKEIRRLVGNIGAVGSHSFFRIINRPHHKFPDILLFQRF